MPIHRARGPRGGKGWQYGQSGKVYRTRKEAIQQMIAIRLSQQRNKRK